MNIYHGTTESAWKTFGLKGLAPRSTHGNPTHWEEHPSHEEFVYLTRAYAPYFGIAALPEGSKERIVILEIDFDALDPARLYPDEDYVAQAVWKPGEGSLQEVTARVRARLVHLQELWEISLASLGQVAHRGAIPREVVTRAALVDIHSRPFLRMAFLDPAITPMNYQLCRAKYVGYTEWLFDGIFNVESSWEWAACTEEDKDKLREVFDNRDGIEVHELAANEEPT